MNQHELTSELVLDAICVAFEQSLQRGEAASIEGYLTAHPAVDQRKLVQQLILLELEYLAKQDQLPEAELYIKRLPQHRAAIEAIFEAVKRGTVDQTGLHQPTEKPGEAIDPYRLLEQIGEGGMGVVFMAEQTKPVRRKVALKIIKPGMDTKQVIARFEAERQALAMMDHPNIARVLDAGSTESGRPYFVMELVRGIPITEYCDQNKLPTNERLELFVNVCQAVQHAHTKGIIHRDIKPSNVLVTHHDGVPIPKIIDFGVAKATNQQLTERTLFTAFAQMIGTPLYMSPEQAEMSGLDVDTRSDIYSLGVLLYELLTGTTPVDKKRMQTAAFDEIRRLIREEDPIKPSTAISTLGEEAKSISMRRGTDANKLRQSLTGELDWIVMKALEKDRTRRFQTANDLAEDVQRHLAGETVEACPPTFGYRMKKLTTRYRTQVAVAATFLILLIGSSLLAWGLYAEASKATRIAEGATLREQTAKHEAIELQKEAIAQRNRAEENLRKAENASNEWRKTNYLYNLTRAAAAHHDGTNSDVMGYLTKCDPLSRNWEWHWLNNMSAGGFRKVNLEGTPDVQRFAISPDGTKLAVVDLSSVLRIHSFPSGELIWSDATGVSQPRYVEWSPDNLHVAIASAHFVAAGQAAIWNISTRTKVWMIDDGRAAPQVAFSPDRKHFAVSRGLHASMEYWRLGDEKYVWTQQLSWAPQIVFSPDGHRLYISELSSDNPNARSILSCREVDAPATVLWKKNRDQCSMVARSADGETLFTNGPNNTIVQWDAATGDRLPSTFPSGNTKGCIVLITEPTGRFLCSANRYDGVIHDLKTKTVVRTDGAIDGVFTPDGKHAITAYRHAHGLRILDLVPPKSHLELGGHEDVVKCGFLSNGGSHFYSASSDGTLRQWDLRDGLELRLQSHPASLYACAVSPGGDYYAVGGADGLRLIDSATDKSVAEWSKEKVGTIFWIDFSADGRRIAAAGKPGVARVWDVETRALVGSYEVTGSDIDGLAFCATDGQKLAILPRRTKELIVWGPESSPRTLTLSTTSGFARDAKWCASENLLAVGNAAAVEIWSLDSNERIAVLHGHDNVVTAVCFNKDGSRLFSGSRNGVLKAWDVESREQLLSIRAHTPIATAMARERGIETIVWNEAEKSIITCGGDGKVKTWESSLPSRELDKRRRLIEIARKTVDELYGKSSKQADVLRALNQDQQLTDEVRSLARQIINVRKDRPSAPLGSSGSALDHSTTFSNKRDVFIAGRAALMGYLKTLWADLSPND